ncbi:MAG TPA: hypothetical protein VFV89_12190 [Nocardioides sp.]|uniref:hypothetical protein n=1 Tax=Nocardioides sp. TaxID=35761 RepID=UPI002E30AEF6|nr:hypothetical protein [Nocardioides sp.]HEX5088560.1 hypothetical protein [Nocardioides sp.]
MTFPRHQEHPEMSAMRARYVTACQQLLALGVVVIALVPATRVVSLDVVGVRPGQGVAQPTISVAPTEARERQHCEVRSPRVAEREGRHAGGRERGHSVSRSGG